VDNSFGNHPRHPLPLDMIFEWLIKANINRLAERSASAWDMFHLYSQFLYPRPIMWQR
jgi:hypothetical protein